MKCGERPTFDVMTGSDEKSYIPLMLVPSSQRSIVLPALVLAGSGKRPQHWSMLGPLWGRLRQRGQAAAERACHHRQEPPAAHYHRLKSNSQEATAGGPKLAADAAPSRRHRHAGSLATESRPRKSENATFGFPDRFHFPLHAPFNVARTAALACLVSQ